MGEPPIKMLRYQQQFTFFDAGAIGTSVHFVNLNAEAIEHGLERVLDRLVEEVERHNASLVIVDSFRSLTRMTNQENPEHMFAFLQRLALRLTTWQATTFLIGEYNEEEVCSILLGSLADGSFMLTQNVFRSSMVRQMRVVKLRGQALQPRLHTVRIGETGVQVFPRMLKPIDSTVKTNSQERISTGIPGRDEMLGGGTLRGNTLMAPRGSSAASPG